MKMSKTYSSVVLSNMTNKNENLTVKPYNFNDKTNHRPNFIFNKSVIKKDPEYQKKLELSYDKCLKELCNYEELEEELNRLKFVVDPGTGKQIKTHIFPLNHPDNIEINDLKHSYVFKRSKFYTSFDKPKSFLKKDLISYWSQKRYFVRMIRFPDNKWGLQLSWQ